MIDGKRLRLRALEEADLPRLVSFANDDRVTRHLVSFRLPQGQGDEAAFLKRVRASKTDHVFCVETKRGAFVGVVGFHDIDPIDRACEFGLIIASPQHWGRGYAAEAVRLGVVTGHERLNLNRLEAPVVRSNDVACSMYHQLGFVHEGTLRERRFLHGRYADVLVFAHLASDYRPRDVHRALGASDAEIRAQPARFVPAPKRPRARRR